MKRKIIKLGEQTLVVSLPAAWVDTHSLAKGDEVDVTIDDVRLVLTPTQKTLSSKAITIDISGISERVLRWQISSLHKQGYDEIVLTSYTPDQLVIIEELVEKLFVGFIIKEQSQLRIVIGQVALVDANEFDVTLRRAFRLLDTMFEDLKSAFLTQDKRLLAKQFDYERTNNKLTNFCERLLNKTLTQKEKGHFWYVIAWNLEKIADIFKYIAQSYEQQPTISEEALDFLVDMQDYAKRYYACMYEFSFPALVKLSEHKASLEKTCLEGLLHAQEQERILYHYLHQLVLYLADFSASMIALRFNPKS